MILLEPERTQWDLNWRMWGIPVRVHPLFWLITLLLGLNALQDGFAYLLVWAGCVFVSILVHELGHIFMGLTFGARGHIVLYSFGGLAIGSNDLRGRGQRVAVSFAGPVAGFVLLGLTLLIKNLLEPPGGFTQLARAMLFDLTVINLVWGILNLMPIWPLDGGQITREVLDGFLPGRGLRLSLQISVGCAILLALQSLAAHAGLSPISQPSGIFNAIFFGLLGYSSYRVLQQLPRGRGEWEEEHSWDRRRAPWESDPDDWKRR